MDTWLVTIISLIGSTALSTIVGLIIKNSVSKKMDEQKELLELRESKGHQERKQEMTEIIKAELLPVTQQLDSLSEAIKKNNAGTVTLLRESLKQSRDHLMEKGVATASEVASWHELYNTYAKLGGNNFKDYVDAWKDDVDGLPREKSK